MLETKTAKMEDKHMNVHPSGSDRSGATNIRFVGKQSSVKQEITRQMQELIQLVKSNKGINKCF